MAPMTNFTHLAKNALFEKKTLQTSLMAWNSKKSRFNATMASFCIFFIRKAHCASLRVFSKKPPPPFCLAYLFTRKRRTFLPEVFHNLSIFRGSSDKFYPPSRHRTFLSKKVFGIHLRREIQKNLGLTQQWHIFASFSLGRTLCLNSGIFGKSPPPTLWLVCLFSWKWRTFLPKVLHNWSISQGSSDKFYPPITERAFLTKKSSNFNNGAKFKKV